MSEPDAFGYRPLRAHRHVSTQVAEGKDDATLQPMVNVWFRFNSGDAIALTLDNESRLAVMMPPDAADSLAAQLTQWAARARDRHWE